MGVFTDRTLSLETASSSFMGLGKSLRLRAWSVENKEEWLVTMYLLTTSRANKLPTDEPTLPDVVHIG